MNRAAFSDPHAIGTRAADGCPGCVRVCADNAAGLLGTLETFLQVVSSSFYGWQDSFRHACEFMARHEATGVGP